MTIDPASGRLLVWSDNEHWEYNAETKEWRMICRDETCVNGYQAAPWLGNFALQLEPIPKYGIIMFWVYNGVNSKVYLYRYK